MIGMVIADDEILVRQGLMTIQWVELGVEVRGLACDGLEALEMVRTLHPQIILTDIRMPGMDGLQLVKTIKEEYPGIKAIMLTGYQDFNYAYTAIQLGAFGYILKPSAPKDIIDIILQAKNQIENEMNRIIDDRVMRNKIESTRMTLFETFLVDLVLGRLTHSSEVRSKSNEFNFSISRYAVVVLEENKFSGKGMDESYSTELQEFHSKIKIAAEDWLLGNTVYYLITISSSTICMLIDLSKIEVVNQKQLKCIISGIVNQVKNLFNIWCCGGISMESNDLSKANVLYNQAINCLNLKFNLGKGFVVHVEDMLTYMKGSESPFPLKHTEKILGCMKAGSYQTVETLTKEMLNYLSKECMAEEQVIKNVCIDLVGSAIRQFLREGLSEALLTEVGDFHYGISKCVDIDELSEYTINLLNNIMDCTNNSKTDIYTNRIVTEIIEYISNHFSEDLTVGYVADFVHISPTYLSRLIKKNLGETFLDVLIKVRMSKASELLRNSSMKTYEVSLAIGIKDSRYFSQIFRKYYGVTPTEFREQLCSRGRNLDGGIV